jgi:hypothetical protein
VFEQRTELLALPRIGHAESRTVTANCDSAPVLPQFPKAIAWPSDAYRISWISRKALVYDMVCYGLTMRASQSTKTTYFQLFMEFLARSGRSETAPAWATQD